MNFQLKYSEVLQGLFKPGKLNLMMVFQVNCPGCFTHGFPQMIQLHSAFQGKISCFALSTAFEDFDVNTIENTECLLKENRLTGESSKAFDSNNLTWDKSIPFPVLFDKIVSKEEMLQPQFIDSILSNHPHFSGAPQAEQVEIKKALNEYFSHYQKCGHTFAANLLQGTPTFVLFNSALEIELQWFGHMDNQIVETKLKEYLLHNLEHE